MGSSCSPLLKWPGGKSRLADRILSSFVFSSGRWVEPFLGSASVFLSGASSGRIGAALLSDRNARLIGFHQAVRDRPGDLLEALSQLPKIPDEAAYYHVRDQFNEATEPSDPEQAARLLWLNKSCFNGVYRENRAGKFNVPFGRYSKISLPTSEHVLRVSGLFSGIEIRCADYAEILAGCGNGDRVYCDPPYLPATSSPGFTAYSSGGFSMDDQVSLAALSSGAAIRGASVVLSNHDVPIVAELYPPDRFSIEHIQVHRSVSRGARGRVGEVILSSFSPGVPS